MNRKLKIIATFIGLKLLEIAAILGSFAICFYVVYVVQDWSFCNILGNILTGIVILLWALVIGFGLIIIIKDWIKSNWKWAKEIVDKDT